MRILRITKTGHISAFSLFCILYICRIVVSLTHMQSIMAGKLSMDMVFSVVLAFFLTLLFSVPAVLCVTKNKNPLCIKGVNYLYAANFIFLAAVNVCRFSYFASARLNPDAKSWGFSLLIFLFAVYAACLGIEGMSRFSGFAFCLIVLVIALVLGYNIPNFESCYLFPLATDSVNSIVGNAFVLSANTAEIVLFLSLAEFVREKKKTAFFSAISCAYFTIFLLFLFSIGVMGDAAGLQAFPIYSLSQLAAPSHFVRMDVLYTSFWIFAIFIKAAVLIYCASNALGPSRHRPKCVAFGLIAFAVACAIGNYMSVGTHSVLVTLIPFVLFSTVIPLVTLFLPGRKGRLKARQTV